MLTGDKEIDKADNSNVFKAVRSPFVRCMLALLKNVGSNPAEIILQTTV